MKFINPIYFVEQVYRSIEKRETIDEESIRKAGELLGTPLKRVEVFVERYRDVFTRFIEKRCSDAGNEYRVCIYSWNRRRTFKSFPVSNYATGTIILFEGEDPVETLVTPLPKALDYFEESEIVDPDTVPVRVTARVDGWQVNAYFDKILGRWIFSTRYVLHNMYFSLGKLVVGRYGEILNPIISVADSIAQEKRLYDSLDRFRGWVFVFSLEGPEPAIISPPYPVAPDPTQYRLYLVAARDPSGKLYSGEEINKEISWNLIPRVIEPKKISELYREIKDSLNTRSYIAWINRGSEDPMLVEISSRLYYEAMMLKHMYDAKSALILCSEGLCDKSKELVGVDLYKERIDLINSLYQEVIQILEKISSEDQSKRLVDSLKDLLGKKIIEHEEVMNELRSRNHKRLAKKILSLSLENKSIASQDISDFIESLRSILRSLV